MVSSSAPLSQELLRDLLWLDSIMILARTTCSIVLVAWAVAILFSSPASAHRIAIGLTGFPEHLLHPLLTLHQLLLLIVASVLASRQWSKSVWLGVASLIAGIVGGWGTQYFLPEALPSYWTVAFFILTLSAAVASLAPSSWVLSGALMTALIGGVFGLDTYNLAAALLDRVQPPAGAALAATILILVLGWLLSRDWPRGVDFTVRVLCGCIAVFALFRLLSELGT